MEAVRLKELEMKQAAEILGVSYGTLYGRYRDVYGCINRPYRIFNGTSSPHLTPRAVRDFWQTKGPSEVLDRLQRGEMTLETAAQSLGVSIANLAAHLADFGLPEKAGKWPTIRVASLDSLRGGEVPAVPAPAPPASPSALMRTRPDLTIVAARRSDHKQEEDEAT
ncbi:hypothetical protein HF086_014032 [Spodoptera exigua]|uniref:Uncharacterized protein n=1 Tax=Spodoptera exigua TaxID=7107 RepID=A0A922SMP7_SPOEX|nr:hypothetical protein HF086_014032 [Spodoptera exigua]